MKTDRKKLDIRTSDNRPCNADCEFTWSNWTECSVTCGSGTKEKYPNITKTAEHGGRNCPGIVTETCNTDSCSENLIIKDPVDCNFQWSAWSQCSVRCGDGIKIRKQNIITQAVHNGMKCQEILTETVPCKEAPCAGSTYFNLVSSCVAREGQCDSTVLDNAGGSMTVDNLQQCADECKVESYLSTTIQRV